MNGLDVDLAVVVLKIEPRSLDRSIARQIGPPIHTVQGVNYPRQLIFCLFLSEDDDFMKMVGSGKFGDEIHGYYGGNLNFEYKILNGLYI